MLNILCNVFCCICKKDMDYNNRYGRFGVCCSKICYKELQWRDTLSLLNLPYEKQKE